MAVPVTLVTGGSGAIGSAIIQRLAQEGHRLVNLSNDDPPAGLPATSYRVDLMNSSAAADVLRSVATEFAIDNLVNNAGFTYVTNLEELSLERVQAMFEIHNRAALQCIQAVVPAMKEKRRGRIVSIGSRMMLGRPGRTVYGMVKAALLGMTRSLSLELAPSGITVNMVSPGPIETTLFRQYHSPGDLNAARVISAIPVGRIGQPDDVAQAVSFFVADGSSFITGQNLFVCGGGSVGSAPI